MQLTPLERLSILGVLPRESSFATLRIVRQLENALSFSEDDLKAFGVVQEGNMIRVANNRELVDIPIGERATELIKSSLKELSKAGKLTMAQFSIYEKFVGED